MLLGALREAGVRPTCEELATLRFIAVFNEDKSALGIAEIGKAMAKGGTGITFPAPITRAGPGWRADV